MALFTKQDFDPPVLSRKWISMKFRPNMLIYSRDNIIAILESGLLFREDSIEVEQEAPDAATAWSHAGGTRGGWFTTGERNLALVATVALLLASPPRNLQRWSLVKLATCALVPLATRAAHRARCGGSLRALLALMRDYVSLTRRATACCCEYAALRATLESVSTAIQSTRTLMCRQQTEMMVLMSRASSALLGNMPWLHGDVTYEFPTDNLTKMYYAFLVVQSNLLKLIALAHHMPAARLTHIYRNHNERVYWTHNVLVHHLLQEFRQNYEALERMYRLLKNYGTRDSDSALKKQGLAANNTWLYSEVHAGVVRSGLELKLALDKCRDLDMFLDSCASNRQQLDLEVLDRDIDGIISDVTKCLSTIHGSQMRLKKMLNRTRVEEDTQKEEDEEVSVESVVRIEDRDPEVRDEVFYCVKTDDDEITSPVGDIITGPGKQEEENSKVVLTELKRKLVKREDLMRERERQALAKTLPDPRNVPEFPRQMPEECGQRKALIARLRRNKPRRLLKRYPFKRYKIWWRVAWRRRNFSVITSKYENHSDLPDAVVDANCNHPSAPVVILTIVKVFSGFLIVVWRRTTPRLTPKDCLGILSSGLSDVTSEPEDSTESKNTSDNHNVNRHKKISHLNDFKFSKKDLELSPSSSETDFEHLQNERVALLDDIRRHRVGRKKNFPARRPSTDNADEGLKPIEYSFGTGMAMASVLQVNSNAKPHNMLQEEVFTGDGEVSNDSGNDEDA